MFPLFWISLALLTCSCRCERHQQSIRHQRTRYLSLGSHFFDGNTSYPAYSKGYNPSSRPLFSWDTPSNELSTGARDVNYNVNNSDIKPTIWHGRKKLKPPLKVAKKNGDYSTFVPRTRAKPVSFRKSYVYKAIPSEEVRPAPSKKIIYVVSRKKIKHNRRKDGRRCKNPKKCGGYGKRRYPNIARSSSNDVDYFPKGLIAEGISELRNAWNNRRNKSFRAGGGGHANENPKTSDSGPCSKKSCEHICTEEDGRASCSCYSGFRVIDGSKCVDVDECEINNGGCDGTCINTIGSRRCLCEDGFRFSPNDDKCVDINECLLRNGHGPCQDTCINTMGGYYCTCDGLKATILSRDNHTCEEVNDCESGIAGCSHSCISTFGRSFCTCPDGYELGDDWKTCHDIDECFEFPDRCDSECVNTVGSYYCEMENTLSGQGMKLF